MMRKRLALLTLVGLLGLGTGATAPALAQDRVAQEETTNNEDEGKDWGWIGLLGLLGLGGLLKRDRRTDVHRDDTRTTGSRSDVR